MPGGPKYAVPDFADDVLQHRAERVGVDHGRGRQPGLHLCVDPRPLELPPPISGEQLEEGALRSAVAIPERVQGIQVGKETAGLPNELGPSEPTQVVPRSKVAEDPLCLAFEVDHLGEQRPPLGERPVIESV